MIRSLVLVLLLVPSIGWSQFNWTSGFGVNVGSSITLTNGGIGRTAPNMGYSNSIRAVFQPFGLIQVHAGYDHVYKASTHRKPYNISLPQYDRVKYRFHDHDLVFGGVCRISFIPDVRPFVGLDVSIPLGSNERTVGVRGNQIEALQLGQDWVGKVKYTLGVEVDLDDQFFLRFGGYWMEEPTSIFRDDEGNFAALGIEVSLQLMFTN